jgi:hypothetical protein
MSEHEDAQPEVEEHVVPQNRVRIHMSDGSNYEVRILNRDRVLWDKTAPRKKWGAAQDVPFLASTFLAWAAARREGLTALNFDAFCDQADDVEDVKEDDDDIARPTRKAPGPGSA